MWNLGLLSPRCHSAKHHGWTLLRHPDGSISWHSPLHRHYDRPGPWHLPPKIDLWADPPPLRPRPNADPPADSRDTPLLDDLLLPPEPESPPPPAPDVIDVDEPPPF